MWLVIRTHSDLPSEQLEEAEAPDAREQHRERRQRRQHDIASWRQQRKERGTHHHRWSVERHLVELLDQNSENVYTCKLVPKQDVIPFDGKSVFCSEPFVRIVTVLFLSHFSETWNRVSSTMQLF